MISRAALLNRIAKQIQTVPASLVAGPRACGLSTLGRQVAALFKGTTRTLDLDDARQRETLRSPGGGLDAQVDLLVLDSVESAPELAVQLLRDHHGVAGRILLLSAMAPAALPESLVALPALNVGGFTLSECPAESAPTLWFRGGLPLSYLASSDADSAMWRRRFLQEALDSIPASLARRAEPDSLRRFWTMLAHAHGQLWNSSEFARALGVAHTTAERWRAQLSEALLIDELPAWRAPIAQRQRSAARIFVRDTGLLHALLGVQSAFDLRSHPKVGLSWEWFATVQVAAALSLVDGERFHWASYTGGRIDLLAVRQRQRHGFVFQLATPLRTPRGAANLIDALGLQGLDWVVPGDRVTQLDERVRVVGVGALDNALSSFPPAA
jgi:predicted AAA+ superfamily ATPase